MPNMSYLMRLCALEARLLRISREHAQRIHIRQFDDRSTDILTVAGVITIGPRAQMRRTTPSSNPKWLVLPVLVVIDDFSNGPRYNS
jgi:hypothetical protein